MCLELLFFLSLFPAFQQTLHTSGPTAETTHCSILQCVAAKLIPLTIGQIIFIEQRAIERQAQVLSFLVTDHSCFIREGVDGLDIISFLLSDVVDGTVAGFSILVDLAVANALEPAHTGQSSPKTAHPGKHIKITDQVISSPS